MKTESLTKEECARLVKALAGKRIEVTRELHDRWCAPAHWENADHRAEDYAVVDKLISILDVKSSGDHHTPPPDAR